MASQIAYKIALIIASPVLILHEGCHYVVARALGIQVKFGLRYVTLYNTPKNWRTLLVTLAPSIIGVIVSVVSLVWMFWAHVPTWIILLIAPIFVLWQGTCASDFIDAYRAWRYDKWQHWRSKEE